ncbi:glycosyltransferase [Vibrio nigripulchritudo]|uniref:glycosyltransferase n=1 Tax=Vibrio nigripulchritudo TaxID=28173 RepID=UPI0003B1989C|nr:glycosyltransferase [Vibrio nigripulchritudo]CCN70294.1 putative glycosyltransferase family 2 [Vibrio nigripulchritudo SFn118]
MLNEKKVAVVVPSYRVVKHILNVIDKIPNIVDKVYIVDDCCDQGSGNHVRENCSDPRVKILWHDVNQGVGGALVTGYKEAIRDEMDVVVKVDGDDQMNPKLIPQFINPLIRGEADYSKGNRFCNLSNTKGMPKVRFIGNIGLSFLTKLSSGYWKNFDPTNGYTAITVPILKCLPLDDLSKRYFFESDILFRLGVLGAKVIDIPMVAVYGSEVSNLHVRDVFWPFMKGNLKNFVKRIFYKYFLQDFNIASLELFFGILFLLSGMIYGGLNWFHNAMLSSPTPVGTIVVSALLVIVGFQLILSFLSYDISSYPKESISDSLADADEMLEKD